MKKSVSILSIAYFTFVLLLVLSRGLSGIISGVMYYLAFIIPFCAVMMFCGGEVPRMSEFSLGDKAKKIFWPTVFPTVTAIAAFSFATTAVIALFGGSRITADVGDDLIFALSYYALLPSILEEMLFRYLPMRYIAPYSRRYAVIFSAVFFSLAHHSFFSIPYAFFAGAVFMTLDILCESCLPSILLHFINNAMSVVWMMYFEERFSGCVLFLALAVPTVVSLVFIFRQRRRYIDGVLGIFSDKEENFVVLPMIFAAIVSVTVAVIELTV